MNIKTSIIVAMAENNCIGKDNKMPWHISDDLKRFKALTTNHPVIMGRKTFESIIGYLKKPLPNRHSIVISRSEFKSGFDEAPTYSSLEGAIIKSKEIAKANNLNEIFIIGGAQIYDQSLKLADRIHLTQVHQSVEGDAFFPKINDKEWAEKTRADHLDHAPAYSFITLERA